MCPSNEKAYNRITQPLKTQHTKRKKARLPNAPHPKGISEALLTRSSLDGH
jgi:hypothetical protein